MPSTQFHTLVDNFIDDYLARYPARASGLGFHEFDGQVTDYEAATIRAWADHVRAFLRRLEAVEVRTLAPEERLDYDVLRLALQLEVFEIEELRYWQRLPMVYTWPCDVSGYIKRDYAPLGQRAQAVLMHLKQVPRVAEQARANLDSVIPRPFIRPSVDAIQGMATFLREDLMAELTGLDDAMLVEAIRAAAEVAARAVSDLAAYVGDELAARAGDEFAIGSAAFSKMLWLGEGVDVSLDDLLQIGQQDLARNLAAFERVAHEINPELTPEQIMQELSAEHPSAESLVADTRDMLEELRQWTIDHDVVSVPSDVRIKVDESPRFMRWAFAMMDAPGAFEQVATDAYYYVTPPEPDWPPHQQDEWLSKFDYYTLRDVGIHEAYPGHYVHFLHYRNTPGKVRRIFGAYSFWEAWAHYVEQMMLDEGYRAGELKLRLAQLSEALLRNVRFMVAIRMHTQGMTVDDATRMFIRQAYMQEKPARQEALRGTFDPGFLNYTLGKLMLLKLRQDYRASLGDGRFNVRQFHDRFLSYGAPPLPLVRREMLGGGAIL